jgi:hypothetical protein
MKLLHLLNIADYVFMAAGVGVALLMIAMGNSEEQRGTERLSSPEPPEPAGRPQRVRRG